MNRRNWTSDEIRLLKQSAGVLTAEQIGKRLGRSVDSVKHKARKSGVSLKTHGERCSWAKYSDHDCELARQLHDEGLPLKEIVWKLEIPYHTLHSIIYYRARRAA